MKRYSTKKEYNLQMQRYVDTKAYVQIFRTVCGEEENLSGFIVGLSKHLLLMQLDNDFILDGFAVIRLDDFDSVRHSNYERARRKIFKAEGLLATGYGLSSPLSLTSWRTLLTALKGYDMHVVVENINQDFLDFWIGPIKSVSEKSVRIHNYDPAGQLDDKPTAIPLDTISVLKFGDRYSTILRKYLKKVKK